MSEKKTAWLTLDKERSTDQPTLEEAHSTDPEAQAFNVVWPVADRLLGTWVKVGPTKSGWSVTIQNSSGEDLWVVYDDDYDYHDDGGKIKKKTKKRKLSYFQERTFYFEEKTAETRLTLRFKERALTAVLLATNPAQTQ